MARAALSATRAVEVIDFLAAHSPAAFSLSEIARALDVNVASLHAILGSLTKSGHLMRHPKRKTYALGSGLIGIGVAAQMGDPVYRRAAPLVESLSRELSVDTLLCVRLDDEIMGLASRERGPGTRSWMRAGQRLPLLPPQGAALVAWDTAEAIDAWISRATGGRPDPVLEENLRAHLTLIRGRGYTVSLREPMPHDLETLAGSYLKSRYVEDLDRQMLDFRGIWNRPVFDLAEHDDDVSHDVGFIAVPLFGGEGRATHSLSLFNFDRAQTTAEIRTLVGTTLAACANLIWDPSTEIRPAFNR